MAGIGVCRDRSVARSPDTRRGRFRARPRWRPELISGCGTQGPDREAGLAEGGIDTAQDIVRKAQCTAGHGDPGPADHQAQARHDVIVLAHHARHLDRVRREARELGFAAGAVNDEQEAVTGVGVRRPGGLIEIPSGDDLRAVPRAVVRDQHRSARLCADRTLYHHRGALRYYAKTRTGAAARFPPVRHTSRSGTRLFPASTDAVAHHAGDSPTS
jgi:hypothetical protein